jgi:hypothetical protein
MSDWNDNWFSKQWSQRSGPIPNATGYFAQCRCGYYEEFALQPDSVTALSDHYRECQKTAEETYERLRREDP